MCPSRPTRPFAKSELCVIVQSERPSPWTTTGRPLPHPVDRRVALGPAVHGEGNHQVPVGKRRPDHRRREPLVAVSLAQQLLAGDLVPGVLPPRIRKGGGFRDQVMCQRLLVGARRTDEYVLTRAAAEKADALLDRRGSEGDEVDHGVPRLLADRVRDGLETRRYPR